jgi:hypothetical protein
MICEDSNTEEGDGGLQFMTRGKRRRSEQRPGIGKFMGHE